MIQRSDLHFETRIFSRGRSEATVLDRPAAGDIQRPDLQRVPNFHGFF